MSRSQRKDDHMNLALQQQIKTNDFDEIRFHHHSFPNLDFDDINLETDYLNHRFSYPFYINAMTGGSLKTKEVNKKLALLAKRYNLMMVVGSQHAALDDPGLAETYSIVRKVNPDGFILGNLNPNATVEDAKRAIEMLDANALSIHVNPAQELTMDEGDRNFKHWLNNIKAIVEAVSCPVIVKEVGFGMSYETVKQLKDIGVQHVDVSGRGGTNFVAIENDRSISKNLDYLETWGLSTVESLLINRNLMEDLEILASGGVRNPLDIIKALSLGAKAVGMSGFFLRLAHKEASEMVDTMDEFITDFKKIMLLLGAKNPHDLVKTKIILPTRFEGYDEE